MHIHVNTYIDLAEFGMEVLNLSLTAVFILAVTPTIFST
jgi:hypothetical protein